MSERMARMVEPAVDHGVKELSKGAPVEHTLREVAMIGLMIGVGYPAPQAVQHVERKEWMMERHHHHHGHPHHCEPCHGKGPEVEVVMVEMPGAMHAGRPMGMHMPMHHMPMHMPMQMPVQPGPGAYNTEAAAITGYGSAAFPNIGAYFPLFPWT